VRQLLGNGTMLLRFIGKRGNITECAATTPDGTVTVRAANRRVASAYAPFAHNDG